MFMTLLHADVNNSLQARRNDNKQIESMNRDKFDRRPFRTLFLREVPRADQQ